jgi:hypothetical protein
MRTLTGWLALLVLALLTLFEGLLLALGQFGHDFNTGGPTPPSLQYGWLFFVLKVAALAISMRSGLPLLFVGILDWLYGVVIFQMHSRHLPFMSALGNGWMETSFFLLTVVYVMTNGYQGLMLRDKPRV